MNPLQMPKLLIHTQYYPPEIGAPQARLSELASGLKKHGFDIIVLTAMPNYPKGCIFDGYGGLRKKENRNDIPITRTYIYPTKKLGFFPRLLNYFSFVFSSIILGVWGLGKVDYIVTESPPLFLGISGFFLSRLKGAKWIFNVSDLWPESAVHLGVLKDGLFLSLANWLEAFCYRHAWLVTGQSHSILSNIKTRFPDVTTYHLSNGVNTSLFHPEKFQKEINNQLAPNNEIIAFYGGLHGLAQGLDQILYAAKELSSSIKVVLIGDGPEKERLVKLAKDLLLEHVMFLDAVEKKKMPGILASVDICLIPLKVNLPGAVPSKLYEAMASAKPVLMIAEGEAADIVCKHQVGYVVKPGDISGIVAGINRLANDYKLRERLGKNGREAAVKYFSREEIINKFAKFLEKDQRR